MAIFKKNSPLEGNPCMPSGELLEFTGMYYETDDADKIAYVRGFKNYTEVESREEITEAKPIAKAQTGTMSAAGLATLAKQNS